MSMRRLLESNRLYHHIADQIIEHVTQLCTKLTPLPFYTLHNEVHLRNVESNLDKMLFPRGDDLALPQLNETEVFLLLTGAWLHDIGMLRGLLDDDIKFTDDHIRHSHEKRSATYISDCWPPTLDLGPGLQWYKVALSNIVFYHRKRNNISECAPEMFVEGLAVRMQLLASLLRLADAAELSGERTPDFLRRLYFAMGMNAGHLEHWARYQLVNAVTFEQQSGEIVIHALIPKTNTLGDFDFRAIVSILVGEVQEELETVHPILASYRGLAYRTVTMKCQEVNYFPNRNELIQAFAPYIVMEQPSAGTMAARFADVLLEACSIPGQAPQRLQDYAAELFQRTDERRPGNVALANVWRDLQAVFRQRRLSEVRSGMEQITRHWLHARQQALDQIKASAPKVDLIHPGDLVVVLGYSSCVRALLTGIPNHSEVHIYVAEVRGRALLPWRSEPEASEGISMALEAKAMGYDTSFVEAAWVPTFFELNKQQPLYSSGRIIVICGVRGILKDGSMLNTPGHLSIAIAAKAFDIPFYAVTELSKLAHESVSQPRTVKPSREFSDIPHSRKLRDANISIRRPYLDLVPASLITGYITELGVMQPHEVIVNLEAENPAVPSP